MWTVSVVQRHVRTSASDLVLQQVAQILQTNIRTSIWQLATAGKSFVIVLPHTALEGLPNSGESASGDRGGVLAGRPDHGQFRRGELDAGYGPRHGANLTGGRGALPPKRNGHNCVSHFVVDASGEQAQETIRQSEARFRAAVEAAGCLSAPGGSA